MEERSTWENRDCPDASGSFSDSGAVFSERNFFRERIASIVADDVSLRSRLYRKVKGFPAAYESYAETFNAENPNSPIPENFELFKEAIGIDGTDIVKIVSNIRKVVSERLSEIRERRRQAEFESERLLAEFQKKEALRRTELRKTMLETQFLVARKALQYHCDQCVRYSNPLAEHNRHYEAAYRSAEKMLEILQMPDFFSHEETTFHLDEIRHSLAYVFLEFTDDFWNSLRERVSAGAGDSSSGNGNPSEPIPKSSVENIANTAGTVLKNGKKSAWLEDWKNLLERRFPYADGRESTFREALVLAAESPESFWTSVKIVVMAVNSVLESEKLPIRLAVTSQGISSQWGLPGGFVSRDGFFRGLWMEAPKFGTKFRRNRRHFSEFPVSKKDLSDPSNETGHSRQSSAEDESSDTDGRFSKSASRIASSKSQMASVVENALTAPIWDRLVKLLTLSKEWNRKNPESSLPGTLDEWLVESGAWEGCVSELESIFNSLNVRWNESSQAAFARACLDEIFPFLQGKEPEEARIFLSKACLSQPAEYPLTVESLYRLSGNGGIQIFQHIFRTVASSFERSETDSEQSENWNRLNRAKRYGKGEVRPRTKTERNPSGVRAVVEHSFFSLLHVNLSPFVARFDPPLRGHLFSIFHRLIEDEAVPEHLQPELLDTRVIRRGQTVAILFSKNLTAHLSDFSGYLANVLIPEGRSAEGVEYLVEVAGITVPMEWGLEGFQEDSRNDPYAILNIRRTDSEGEAKKKYRQLMMRHHPDRQNEAGANEAHASEITKAWRAVCQEKGWNG